MSGHTPGPWSVHPADTPDALDVMTLDGFYVASCFEMTGENDAVVTDANANLIAAAPDLLAILTEAHEYLAGNNKNYIGSGSILHRKMGLAIAKAEGQQ